MSPRFPLRVVASEQDALATALVELARGRGFRVEALSHEDAAFRTTVEVTPDGARVWPETALFLRPSFEAPPSDRDEGFLLEERTAHLWAAAALSPLPVLNRPTRRGLYGRGARSGRVSERRAGLPFERAEIFCTEASRRDWPGCWAAESADGTVGVWPRGGSGAFRARPVAAGEAYEAAIVVGSRAWRRSDEPLEHLELEVRSLAVAARLSLGFATVWWAVSAQGDSASFVRAVAAPSLQQVASRWPEVGSALLSSLS